MFFLLMFVFLPKLICCSEVSRDICLQGYEEFIIGYIDSAKSCFKPFNGSSCAPIELQQSELSEMSKPLLNNHTIIRDNQPVKLMVVPSSCDFSAVANVFCQTNLDDNQKHYVSNILNAAEDLQLTLRKYTKLELGQAIMAVLSTFITESFKSEILDSKDIKNAINLFLWNFNKECKDYYHRAYEKTQIHPKTDVCLGLFLILCLYYMHTKNLHFIPLYHKIEKLILIAAYAAFLRYDLKDRGELYMAYQSYEIKYKALTNPYANNKYLFDKFAD